MLTASRLKHVLKLAVAHALYCTGVLQLWQSVVLRRKAVVLMYHRVLTDEERRRTGSHPGIVVDRDTFEEHMALLKRRFVVLTLDDFAQRMEEGVAFPDSACLITFDDGWEDNFVNALPILRKYGFPAVVFLPVRFIGERRLFWREALAHLLAQLVLHVRRSPAARHNCEALLAPLGIEMLLDMSDDDPRHRVLQAVWAQPAVRAEEIERVIPMICAELGIRIDELHTPDTFMDWDQVERMSRERIAFGGHGAEHRLLTRVAFEEAQSEIGSARQMTQRTLKGTVPAFSYPNGSWNPQIAALVEGAGYRLAFTTDPGFVSCEDDRFAVKRMNIHQGASSIPAMFLARVVGLF